MRKFIAIAATMASIAIVSYMIYRESGPWTGITIGIILVWLVLLRNTVSAIITLIVGNSNLIGKIFEAIEVIRKGQTKLIRTMLKKE